MEVARWHIHGLKMRIRGLDRAVQKHLRGAAINDATGRGPVRNRIWKDIQERSCGNLCGILGKIIPSPPLLFAPLPSAFYGERYSEPKSFCKLQMLVGEF
jgi:hypothetical protein